MDVEKRKMKRRKLTLDQLIPPGVDALLNTRQVCAALSVCNTKFRRLRRNELFPPPDVHIGQAPRWRASTFNRWLATHAKSACPGMT